MGCGASNDGVVEAKEFFKERDGGGKKKVTKERKQTQNGVGGLKMAGNASRAASRAGSRAASRRQQLSMRGQQLNANLCRRPSDAKDIERAQKITQKAHFLHENRFLLI